MLSEAIQQAARTAIEARFELRDQTLISDLEKLASRADAAGEEDLAKIGVRLRLVCEHDLFERAHMVWLSLKRAHHDRGARRTPTLMDELMTEARHHMKRAALSLASHLKQHATPFAPLLAPPGGLDGRWLDSLCRRATERYARDMEDYVAGLRRGLGSLVSSIRVPREE